MRLAYIVYISLLIWQATIMGSLAGGGCHNCGICPSGTAANFWELGRPDFSLGFGDGGLSSDLFDDDFPFINPLPIVAASTDCGTDLQVGGACESFCIYVNAFATDPACNSLVNLNCYASTGTFFAAHAATNGWAAEGAKAGTVCGLASYYEFYENEAYFFLCGTFPWKLCCRPPGYTPYIWPSPGFGIGDRSSAASLALPTAPGLMKPLPNKVVDEILAHKANPDRFKNAPKPSQKIELPAWARQLVATKGPLLKRK